MNTCCHFLVLRNALDGLDTRCFLSRPLSIYCLYLLVLIISGFVHLPILPYPHPSIHHFILLPCMYLISIYFTLVSIYLIPFLDTYLLIFPFGLSVHIRPFFFIFFFLPVFRSSPHNTSTLYPAGLDWIHFSALPFDLLTSLPESPVDLWSLTVTP